jgi:predicted transcriptional regulator
MPGGRLTVEDRRQVAAGLSQGLKLAEIARRLSRPTSTVSREVARNGGPRDYRADSAIRATRRRASRAKAARTRSARTAPAADGRDPALVRDFVDRFATLIARTGVPRMTARVLTSLLASDAGAATAAELVDRLGVSPASISKAVGHLEELELVRRERDPRGRRERYLVEADPWSRSWAASSRKHVTWADAAAEGVEIFGADSPAGARLGDLGRFFQQLADDMEGRIAVAPTTADDAMTAVAALVAARRPLAANQLAAALDWPRARVAAALTDGALHPEWTDPIALRRVGARYAIAARAERLTAGQRRALGRAPPAR